MSIFTSSNVFTLNGIKDIEIFLVGGGGDGYSGHYKALTYYESETYGGGGGGGRTITQKIKCSDSINIVVGSNRGRTIIDEYIAEGGSIAYFYNRISYGGGGGSGGGSGKYYLYEYDENYLYESGSLGDGGSNGNGGCGEFGGKGQGTTTRAFGESDGTLYAGGGGGAQCNGGAGGGGNGGTTSNEFSMSGSKGSYSTGGGGGGGDLLRNTNVYYAGGDGGSGIAIIRWGFDKNGKWLGSITNSE